MKKAITTAALLVLSTVLGAQPQPEGKWQDVSKDGGQIFFYGSDEKSTHMLVSEEYEVLQTHEICASVYGYFMEKSNQGRYNVNFKGIKASATFTFTTQWDAEHWVAKFCTARSLLDIKAGRGTFAQNY